MLYIFIQFVSLHCTQRHWSKVLEEFAFVTIKIISNKKRKETKEKINQTKFLKIKKKKKEERKT